MTIKIPVTISIANFETDKIIIFGINLSISADVVIRKQNSDLHYGGLI